MEATMNCIDKFWNIMANLPTPVSYFFQAIMIIAGVILIGLLYFYPTLCAFRRRKRNRVAIAVMNLVTGWMMWGWVVALAWAVLDRAEQPACEVLPRLS